MLNTQEWWAKLNPFWKTIIQLTADFDGEPTATDFFRIERISELDLSGTKTMAIEAVAELGNLRRVNLAGTKVADLSPLANHRGLAWLKLDDTPVESLKPLLYLSNIEYLGLRGTPARSLHDLRYLRRLRELDLRGSAVVSLHGLQDASNLERLYLDGSAVADIKALLNLRYLRVVSHGGSKVPAAELEALAKARPHLQLLAQKPDDAAEPETSFGPPVAVAKPRFAIPTEGTFAQPMEIAPIRAGETFAPRAISPYKHLEKWWDNLAVGWKMGIRKQLALSGSPQGADFERIQKLESLNCDDVEIHHLDPLVQMPNLRWLSIKNSEIESLIPLNFVKKLEYLDISNCPVKDLLPVAALSQLRQLRLSHTDVASLEALRNLFLLESLHIDNNDITDLGPLRKLEFLRELQAHNTKVSSIDVAKHLGQLEVLNLASTQLASLAPLEKHPSLRFIDLGHTPAQLDLAVLETLPKLEKVNHPLWRKEHPQAAANNKLEQRIAEEMRIRQELKEQEKASHAQPQAARAQPQATKPEPDKFAPIAYTPKKKKRGGCFVTLLILGALSYGGYLIWDGLWWQRLSSGWQEVFAQNMGLDYLPQKHEAEVFLYNSSLTIGPEHYIYDLQPVLRFEYIEELRIHSPYIYSLEELQSLGASLTLLDISGSSILSFWGMESQYWLRHVEAAHSGVSDLDGLVGCDALEYVGISYTQVSNIEAATYWPALRQLDLRGLNLYDLAPLQEHGSLATLLMDSSQVIDASPLATIDSLRVWHARACPSLYLDPAADWDQSHLSELYLDGSDITDDELAAVGKMRRLQRLSLAGTSITRIDELRGIKRLLWLDLTGTAVDPAEIEEFRRSRPQVEVVFGPGPGDPALPVEPEEPGSLDSLIESLLDTLP